VRVHTSPDNSEECREAFDCAPPTHEILYDAVEGERNKLVVTQEGVPLP
jgi:hypothetical protein